MYAYIGNLKLIWSQIPPPDPKLDKLGDTYSINITLLAFSEGILTISKLPTYVTD